MSDSDLDVALNLTPQEADDVHNALSVAIQLMDEVEVPPHAPLYGARPRPSAAIAKGEGTWLRRDRALNRTSMPALMVMVPARDGDGRQARRRVNYLVETGLLAAPNTVPCADCGHVWREGEKRHEFDHYLGYAAEHHETVEVVCSSCHHRRESERKAAA